MNNKRWSGYIIGGILILLGIFLMVTYNSLVKKEEQVKLQWNEVQNAYQRRIDFIPNVVNVVKGQADFEQTTLQQLTEARAKAAAVNITGNDISADKFKQQTEAQDGLAAATNRVLITVEKYLIAWSRIKMEVITLDFYLDTPPSAAVLRQALTS